MAITAFLEFNKWVNNKDYVHKVNYSSCTTKKNIFDSLHWCKKLMRDFYFYFPIPNERGFSSWREKSMNYFLKVARLRIISK